MSVGLSIIIRPFNEERHLGRLLAAIREQTLEAWEVEDHPAYVLLLGSYEAAWRIVEGGEQFKVLLLCSPSLAAF